VLGYKCYPYTRPYSSHKLTPRSIPCVFLGYSSRYKYYKCLDLSTNRVYISRHVIFYELSFPFKDLSSTSIDAVNSDSPASLHILPLVTIIEPPTYTLNSHTPISYSRPTYSDTSLLQASFNSFGTSSCCAHYISAIICSSYDN
jgi:hypothetical protein